MALVLEDHQLIRDLFGQLDELGPGEERRDVWETLVRTLAAHETAEEEIVYPTVQSADESAEPIVEERLGEEDAAKKILSDLEKMGFDDPLFGSRFLDLRDAVLAHAEGEEREVLPRLRETQTKETLGALGTAFQAAKAVAPTHPHPRGPESAIGNIVLGPAVAVADRVRDAAREAVRRMRGGGS